MFSSSGVASTYTPAAGDAGKYLRATASYTDGQGAGKSAEAVSTNATVANESGLPRNLTATPSSTLVRLQWDPPTIQGAITTAMYRIRWRTAAPEGQWQQRILAYTGSKPEYTVRSLQPETQYDFEVIYLRVTIVDNMDVLRSEGTASVQATTNASGSVSFDADTPWAGTALTATLVDESGSVSGLTWTWEWLESAGSKSGTAIASGVSGNGQTNAYTPTDADQGKWLRATASYTSANSKQMSARAVTTNSVKMDAITFSATAPTVSAIAVTSTPTKKSAAGIANADTYSTGDTIEVTVTFDQSVTVTGKPSLNLDIGGSRASAVYARGSGGAALVFSYTVVGGDRDDNGVSVPGIYPIALPTEGGIRNAGGEDANLRHTGIADQSGHRVDARVAGGTAPRITSISIVSSPASGTTYGAGETIEILVTWDQLVRGLNRPYPSLTLTLGAGPSTSTRTAQIAISRGSQSRFRYVVQAADADTDGVSIPQNPLTVPQGSFIRNYGNDKNAVLTYAGLAAQSGHKVNGSTDNVRPSAPGHARVSAWLNVDRKPRVLLSWKQSRDETITGYQYQQDGSAWLNIPDSGQDTSRYVITSPLVRGVGHTFKVRAVDAGGAGPASPALKVTWPQQRPWQPTGLKVVAGHGQVTLSWTNPQDPTIRRYEYQQRKQWWQDGTLRYTYFGSGSGIGPDYDPDSDPNFDRDHWTAMPNSGAETVSHSVSGLDNGTTYIFRIRAVNEIGASPYSRDERATPAAP